MSISVGCNMEGVETCHVSNKDPEELMPQFVDILLEMAEKKYKAAVERFKYNFHQLEQLKVQEMYRLEELNGPEVGFLNDDDGVEIDNDDNVMSEGMRRLENYMKSFRSIVRSWLSLDLFLLATT